MKKFSLLLLIVLATALSCGKPIEPDRDVLYYKEAGDEYFTRGKYTDAINAYQNALARAEEPVAAALIQLAIADTYYADKEYIDAIPVYEIYLDLYPNSPTSTLAYMKLGLSHYEIHESANKDLTDAEQAIKYFQIVEKRDPKLFYDNALQDKVAEMRNLLALKEYKIARYYSRIWEDNSSILRYEYILKTYSDTSIAPEAFYRLIDMLVSNKKNDEAARYLQLFRKKFGLSRYYKQAQSAYKSAKDKELKEAIKQGKISEDIKFEKVADNQTETEEKQR